MYNTQSSDRDGNPWTAALPPMVPASPSNSFQPQTPVNPTNLSFGSVSPSVSSHYAAVGLLLCPPAPVNGQAYTSLLQISISIDEVEIRNTS
jgi:hypothetical protein